MIAFRLHGNAIWNRRRRKTFRIARCALRHAAVAKFAGRNEWRSASWHAIPSGEGIALECARGLQPCRTRDAENRSRWRKDPLRDPWRRPAVDPDSRLLLDLGDVAGPDRGAVET